jgi:hypothetical protein
MDLRDIPKIMRNRGWDNGATLMEKWFAGPPIRRPYYVKPDLTTITMDWALTYSRAKDVYDELVSDRIWANAAAQHVMAKILLPLLFNNRGSVVGGLYDFRSKAIPFLKSIQINFRKVEPYVGLNDLVAALGSFSFYVCPLVFDATQNNPPTSKGGSLLFGNITVTMHSIGCLIYDIYEFEGEQFLGYWQKPDTVHAVRVLDDQTMELKDGNVGNSDFREWRMRFLAGGDFEVYSDLKIIALTPKYKFDIYYSQSPGLPAVPLGILAKF